MTDAERISLVSVKASSLKQGDVLRYSPQSPIFATTTGRKGRPSDKTRPCVVITNTTGSPVIVPITTPKVQVEGKLIKHTSMERRPWLPVRYESRNGDLAVSVPEDTGYKEGKRSAAVIQHTKVCTKSGRRCDLRPGYIWCNRESPLEMVLPETMVYADKDRQMSVNAITKMGQQY